MWRKPFEDETARRARIWRQLRHGRSTKTLSRQGAFAVDADGDLCVERGPREREAGELAALIRVEDFRLAMLRQRFFHSFNASFGSVCVG